MLLFAISFIGGVLTILAPCILPLLPIIVGGSLSDGKVNKAKALTIVVSLGLSVIIFTLLLKATTVFITIPPYVWSWISGTIIIVLGLLFVFPGVWENKITALISRKSNALVGKGNQRGGFWGNVITGMALGPVFSTCSPTYFVVLATVLPASPILGMVYLLAFVVGLSSALFLVAIVGQRIMQWLGVAADPKGWFKRILGIIFVIVGIAIFTGADKKFETYLLDLGFFDVSKVEQQLLELEGL